MTYSEKLKDPRWQRKRLKIMERDDFACRHCGEKGKTLNVHHLSYKARTDVWDYEADNLVTLCEPCHERLHETKQACEGFMGDKIFERSIARLCALKLCSIDSVEARAVWDATCSQIHSAVKVAYVAITNQQSKNSK